MRKVLSNIAIIVGVFFLIMIWDDWSSQASREANRERMEQNNSGFSSRYSKEEMYYLGTKAIAQQFDMSSTKLLVQNGYPGINQCVFTPATDGGTAVAFPIRGNDYTTYIVCEIYNDGSCVISSIEQE